MAGPLEDPQRKRDLHNFSTSRKMIELFIALLTQVSSLSCTFHASHATGVQSLCSIQLSLGNKQLHYLITRAKYFSFTNTVFRVISIPDELLSQCSHPLNNVLYFSFPPVQKCYAYVSNKQKKCAYVTLFSLIVVKNINICPFLASKIAVWCLVQFWGFFF